MKENKKITRLEYQKNNKNRVNVYLNDIFAFGIDLNIMIKYSLTKDMELEDEFIEDILKSEEEISTYNYAISILARYSKSEYKLKQKMLQKGYDVVFIEKAIIKLKQNKYLDDERYSEMLIDNKINISKYGKKRIKEALYEKGINKEIIEDKINQLSDEDELERALIIGQKKLNTLIEQDTIKKKMKLTNFLIYKGFDYSIVKKTLEQLLNEDIDIIDY